MPRRSKRTKIGEVISSQSTPRVDTLGVGRWARLTQPNRDIKVTKFIDYSALETLGLADSVTQLLQKIRLEGFVHKWAPTYERFTLNSFLL